MSREAIARKPTPCARQAKMRFTTSEVSGSMASLVSCTPWRAFSGLGWGTPLRTSLVPVRWPAAQVAPLGRHGPRGGPDPHAEPVALGPAEPSEQRQDDVVGL